MGAENWSNGTPTGACDVTIASAGSDVITMTGGINVKSLQLGGALSTPQLVISDQSPNTNLDAQPAGITIAAGASVTLTCLPGGCPNGGPDIYSGASPFANAGTVKVDANTGGGAVVGGAITNTGTIAFEQSGSLGGTVVNQGTISIVDGATATNSGASCGDPGASVKNDTDGLIDGASTGVLSVRNFVQGDGVTKDVQIPCGGTLSYVGDGASEIRATGGFNLTGEMQAGQSLTISHESNNTNAALQSNFTNNGSITLTCPAFGCNGDMSGGGGAGFNVNDKDFVNAGTFTVAASSGTGASLGPNSDGTLVNTGTMSFNQSAALKGPVANKGAINIADEKKVTSAGDSCADAAARVKNDTGGSITGTGSGHLEVRHYEQGAGTTSGSAPVRIPCGDLSYTGTGAGIVQVDGVGTPMTGNLAAGQTLRVIGSVNSGTFTNAGRITGSGTINGSVENSGVVAPGESPGTLSITGSYVQAAGGRLEIEVAGTGAGQHDTLALGGSANLDGTLALAPTNAFAASAAIGDSVPFLTYGGSATGQFAQATVNPELPCGKVFATSLDEGAKALKATVAAGNPCPSGGGGNSNPPSPSPPPVPDTKIGVHPGAKVVTKKAKLKVKFTFSSTVAGATFECKLDKGPYKPCRSPKTFKVKPGKHKLSVRAIGPGGIDATPATANFKVIRQKG